MPELPDITIYIEALEQRIVGHTLLLGPLTSSIELEHSCQRVDRTGSG